MSTLDEAKVFLKRCYDHKDPNGLIATDNIVFGFNYHSKDAARLICYLVDKGYVTIFSNSIGRQYPHMLRITATGIDWVENTTETIPSIQQNIQFQNNYGSVGNGNSVTINNTFSFEHFDNAVSQNTSKNSPVLEEIQELRKTMLDIQQNNAPVQPGVFKRFTKLLQDNAWLTAPITEFLIHIAFRQ